MRSLGFVWFVALLAVMANFSMLPPACAVPACPGDATITQPDGTKFTLRLRGDEFFSWHETPEGYAVARDAADGYWKYAAPVRGQAAFEILSGARVGRVNPGSLNLRKYALPEKSILSREILKRRRQTGSAGASLSSPPSPASSASPSPLAPGEPPAQPPSLIPVSGTKTIKNIVILAAFDDHWDNTNGTVLATRGHVNTTDYDALFNQAGYTTDGAVGSVRDYYREVSYGKLTVSSVVSPWVRLPQAEAYYGADGTSKDTNWAQMVVDAINGAHAAGFDFSQGDSDGDGWVDCLTIIHSGYGQEYGGAPTTNIWSKQGEIFTLIQYNGVSMKRCHIEPALRNLSGTGITRIGVVCHEMGHFFGLPDLYDYSGTTNGLGSWCIMASGSWNGSSGTSPAHMSAWAKYMLGFVSPVRIHSQNAIPLPRVEDNPAVHILQDGTANGEYFLVENRARTGFDNAPQLTAGILIYHAASASEDNDLGTWPHPAVKIEEADGNDSLGLRSSSGQPGDVWTSTSGLPGGFRDQTGNPSTNAMLYQSAHDYNRTDSVTSYTYNRLSVFSAAGTTMTYSAMTLRPALSNQVSPAADYSVSWAPCTNATQYEIQEGVPLTLTSFSDGAEDEELTADTWNLAGTVKRDNTAAKTGAWCYSMNRYFNNKWGSSVQALTMKRTFEVTPSTVISYNYLSHLAAGDGYLKCQISRDNGNTWNTLATLSGYIDPWSAKSHNFAALSAAGIQAGDQCLLRFIANFEYTYGLSSFPGYGYALDDIQVAGTKIKSYGAWSTLSNSVIETAYPLTGRLSGDHAYRVRALANGVWQPFGTIGVVTVNTWTVNFQTDGTPGASLTGALSQSIANGGNCTPVTAVAPSAWHFVNWTSGGSPFSASSTLTVANVAGNMSFVANFAHDPLTLAYLAGANGTVDGVTSKTQTVNYGASGAPVTAIPQTGYHFTQWSDGSTANPRTETSVTNNLTVTASFAINQYALTYRAGAHGTIDGATSKTLTVNHGASGAAVSAVPGTGYHFTQWSDGSTANPRTETNVTQNITVTASFAINQYTLTYRAGANGTVDGVTSKTLTVNHGSSGAPVTVVPAAGYHFVQWSDGSTANPRTDTNVAASLAVTASFAINQYALTYRAGANGTVDGVTSKTLTVSHGSAGSLVTAVPATGYHFVQWSDGSTVNTRTDTNVTDNLTVTASFAINQYSLHYLAGYNGTVDSVTSKTLTVNYGSSGASVTAIPHAGYHFTQWSDGSTANPRIDASVTHDLTVTASFAINQYALTYRAGANGTIDGATSKTQTVSHGTSGTAVSAVPAPHYHFAQWSDGSTVNPRTDTSVTGNLTVTASFAINQYTLTYRAGANGTVDGVTSKTQTVNHGASGAAVSAVPGTGYHFTQWSDGSTANPRTDTNVTTSLAVTAAFAIDRFTVTFQTDGTPGASLTGKAVQVIDYGGAATAVAAVTPVGWRFSMWTVNGAAYSTKTVLSPGNVTKNMTFIAVFTKYDPRAPVSRWQTYE